MSTRLRIPTLRIFAAILLVFMALAARAATTTYNFHASIYTGSVTYDASAPCTPHRGDCGASGYGYTTYTSPDFLVRISDGMRDYSFSDQLIVANNYFGVVDQVQFFNPDTVLGTFNLSLSDWTARALVTELIPEVLDPTRFNAITLTVAGNTFAMDPADISLAQPLAQQSQSVPEPANIALFSVGMAGLALTRTRRYLRARSSEPV